MARALYFTLFCVFQVMSAVTHVLAAPTHNLTSAASETFFTPIMGGDTILDPRGERDHGKRSLNVHPFEEKYLSTTHYTLEVHRDGTVRASRALKPEWGVLRIFAACMVFTNTGSATSMDDVKRNNKHSGKVSIRAIKANKYVCMNKNGEVYGSDQCTEECEFKQDKIGDGSKFRYFSLKHRGFLNDPKRTKKRWYLGLKKGQVLKGYETKKRKDSVQLMLRPVDTDNTISRYVFSSTPPSVDPGESDRNGSVSVVTTSSPNNNNRNTKRPPRTKPAKSPKRRKCPENDPLNLFRFSQNCGKRDRSTRRRGGGQSNPFSTHIRHTGGGSDKKSHRGGTNSRQQPFNLFSIPNR